MTFITSSTSNWIPLLQYKNQVFGLHEKLLKWIHYHCLEIIKIIAHENFQQFAFGVIFDHFSLKFYIKNFEIINFWIFEFSDFEPHPGFYATEWNWMMKQFWDVLKICH